MQLFRPTEAKRRSGDRSGVDSYTPRQPRRPAPAPRYPAGQAPLAVRRAGRTGRGRWAVAGSTILLLVATSCSSQLTPPATPTPASSPAGACPIKPADSNTGAEANLSKSSTTVLEDGATLENVQVPSLTIQGDRVTVRNVAVLGKILVKGDDAMIDRVSSQSIAISSASGTTIQYANISKSEEDAIHITSDDGSLVKNVVLRYNFIHSPNVPKAAHHDGTQVRGVQGLTVSCSTYDAGPYRPPYNAAIYLEKANGGDTDVSIENNWMYGYGFSVMIDATNTRIVGNHVGGDIHWGTCLVGQDLDPGSIEVRDNVNDTTRAPDAMCHSPKARSG